MRTENVAVAEQTRKASLTHAFQLKRWTLKVNPFKSTKTALKPVIQGELSLDRVKPLRNDLSDADLELVAAAKQPEPAPVKIESEEVPVLQAQPFWPRVRSLFARRA